MGRRHFPSLLPMSGMKPSFSAHVTEKHNLESTEKESDFNESIYSTGLRRLTWLQMTNREQILCLPFPLKHKRIWYYAKYKI